MYVTAVRSISHKITEVKDLIDKLPVAIVALIYGDMARR